jgi:hypothetical protein
MEKESRNKSYFKEIGLVLIGGLLASIPILISTNMQSKAQLQQFILDRKLSVLRDYSSSSQKLVTDLFFSMDQFEANIDKYRTKFRGKRFLPVEILTILKADIRSVEDKYQRWKAENNTHTVIINTLFKTNLPQLKFFDYELNDSTFNDTSTVTWEKSFSNMEKRIVEFRKNCIEMAHNEQGMVDELIKLIANN